MSAHDLDERRSAATIDPTRLEGTLDPTRGEPPRALVAPGTFVGDWRVGEALPPGSQAELYEASSGARTGVLKLYHAAFRPVPGVLLAQQAGEARHLVPLWESGTWQGRHFEVFPRLAGTTLREVVEGGRADERFVRDVLVPQLADALAFLRERGIVHADLSPDNVLVSDDLAEVRLADFGVALGLPSPGTLVRRRGTAAFSPRTFVQDGLMEIGEGYDYGSLGLLVAYACLRVSPIAHLDRDAAGRALADGTAFSSVPAGLRELCVALSGPAGGASDGRDVCGRFVTGGDAPRGPVEAFVPGGRALPRTVELIDGDGGVAVATTARELLDGMERNWGAARRLMRTRRLERFLEGLPGGDELVRVMESQERAGADAQVLCLCAGLRCQLDGPGLGPVVWRGARYDDVIALMRTAAEDPASEAAAFFSGDLLAAYCREAHLADPVVEAAKHIVRAPGGPGAVAAAALDAFTGERRDLVVDGRVVGGAEELARWVATADMERISGLVEGDELRGWLFSHGLGDVYREVDSIR